MAIKVNKDSKLIKVLASQARFQEVAQDQAAEAEEIIAELSQDMSPENRHQIAQVIGYTVNDMQQGALDFLNVVADQKNIGYGDKAAFNVKTGGVKAYFQAKGSTTPRSFVSGKQILVDTEEVSARPAINVIDLRTGRVKMADLIREANREITNKKIKKIEQVLHAAVQKFAAPFYGTGTGVEKAVLDKIIAYFRRLGPVNIIGDIEAVSKLAGLVGMEMGNSLTQRTDNMVNEYNENGFIGKYNGCNVIALANAIATDADPKDPEKQYTVLDPNWLYIVPGNMSSDMRNLKIVNEGGMNSFEAQDINDLVFEVRLDQWFGAAFVTGKLPTIGGYLIG